ncbi:hypothetical protein MTR67_039853 [Solanum verrucosum]|uniref:Uncharacterized protein n=1 Tax=Solanum verrucosum TaxID=315347 RepID=A0AAF0UJB3_SOLVR|nr:hypothetical protein MTR67_039853 [Solanum verrucosum]
MPYYKKVCNWLYN